MRIKQNFTSLWRWLGNRSAEPPLQRSGSSWARAWLAGRDDALPNACLLSNAFNQSTWIYACVTALAENVSAIPFRIIDGPEDNERVIQSHPALDLFNSPHPNMDRFQFWELLVTWLCLRGEAFILPSLSSLPSVGNSTRASTLMILNPDHMREVIQDHQFMGWRYTTAGPNPPIASTVFLPEEIIHIKLPNPFNFWRGMSPLAVAWLAAQTDYASSQFMKGTMMNNADTGLIVTTNEQLSDEQHQQILAALRNRKRGAGTPDIPLFLFGGAKVEKPSITAVDLDFLENRKFNRQEICAIYKVPQELLGFTEDANRSVSESARLNFLENRITPLCRRLEAALLPLIRRFDGGGRSGVRGEFHIKGTPIMQAAQRARIDSATKLFGLGVPMNTVNRVLDLGLPALPHGDIAFIPSKLTAINAPPLNQGGESSNTSAAVDESAAGCPDLARRCSSLLSLVNRFSKDGDRPPFRQGEDACPRKCTSHVLRHRSPADFQTDTVVDQTTPSL